MKYYFNKENTQILEVENGIVVDGFDELTKAEKTFYLSCKSEGYRPSVQEVKNGKKNDPIRPSLPEYKEQKITELNNLSLSTRDTLIPVWRRENAISSLLGTNAIYSELDAKQVLAETNRIGELCINEWDRVNELIQTATTLDEVDAAFDSNKYHTFSVAV